MNNLEFAKSIIESLKAIGIRDYVLCSGARNAPLVNALSSDTEVSIYNFFDERSASFWALGKIQKERTPVVLVTTSGTAVSECLSAIIEAQYSHLPLILLTADRPKKYRGTGAPQAIDQISFLKDYTQWQVDLDIEEFKTQELKWELPFDPCHINICFDEPLWDTELNNTKSIQWYPGAEFSIDLDEVESFIQNKKRPLVLVSKLNAESMFSVESFLIQNSLHCYVEAPSGLRELESLEALRVQCGEKKLKELFLQGEYDCVIRVGAVPTTRVWRDLETSLKDIEVYSFAGTNYSGLTRGKWQYFPLDQIHNINFHLEWEYKSSALKLDKTEKEVINSFKSSELNLVSELSEYFPEDTTLFIGNSLPIREWDLVAQRSNSFKVECSRGVNGIDGQISTFLGLCEDFDHNICILGDLTFMYDMNAFWALKHNTAANVTFIVINNSGGKIFERIFTEKLFLNEHNTGFEEIAKLWNLKYHRWQSIDESFDYKGLNLIELIPDNIESKKAWEKLETLWQK